MNNNSLNHYIIEKDTHTYDQKHCIPKNIIVSQYIGHTYGQIPDGYIAIQISIFDSNSITFIIIPIDSVKRINSIEN